MGLSDIFEGIDEKVLARKWEFEVDDKLGGEVQQIMRGEGDYGPYSGYVIAPQAGSTESGNPISADDPVILYVNDNSALARDLPPGRAQVGDVLVVKYFGKGQSKAGREFNNFNVILRPKTATAADGQKADW